MRNFEILRELPKCDRHEVSKCCWKLAPKDLLNLIGKKTQYLQSAIKGGRPVFRYPLTDLFQTLTVANFKAWEVFFCNLRGILQEDESENDWILPSGNPWSFLAS